MPLLHPPLPAYPPMDCRLDPTSRSAAEGNNVPGLQPEPGRMVSPIQLGSDTGLYTWDAPGKPRGGIVVSLPIAPWHTPVRRHRNPCPGLPGEPLLPEPAPWEGDRAAEAQGSSKWPAGSAGPFAPTGCGVGGVSGFIPVPCTELSLGVCRVSPGVSPVPGERRLQQGLGSRGFAITSLHIEE